MTDWLDIDHLKTFLRNDWKPPVDDDVSYGPWIYAFCDALCDTRKRFEKQHNTPLKRFEIFVTEEEARNLWNAFRKYCREEDWNYFPVTERISVGANKRTYLFKWPTGLEFSTIWEGD